MPNITKHAKRRLIERVHARGKDAEKLVSKAYKQGVTVDKLDGPMRRWVRSKMGSERIAKNTRLYKEHLYIFDKLGNLVTVLDVPEEVKLAVKEEGRRIREQARQEAEIYEYYEDVIRELSSKTCDDEIYMKRQEEAYIKLEEIQAIVYEHTTHRKRGKLNIGVDDYEFLCSNMYRCTWVMRHLIAECAWKTKMKTPDECRESMCELLKMQEGMKRAIMDEIYRNELTERIDEAIKICSEIYRGITGEQIKVKIRCNTKSCF